MVRRIVLGYETVGHDVVETLDDRRGDLLVVDESANRVETLRNEGIAAEHADLTAVGTIVDGADVVLVATGDPERTLRAVRAARDAFPDCHLVVYASELAEDARHEVEDLADAVFDPGHTVADALLDVVEGEAGWRLRSLAGILRELDGPLGVFTHDDPDPDAIGSAIALVAIARARGREADAYYFGEIAHQENRALVNLLDLDLTNLDPEEFDPSDFGGIALVDHSRPGVNDSLPSDTQIDLVIDHHPPRGPVSAQVIDVQSDVGATSTLLSTYFERFGLTPDPAVATALLYGIRVDTRDFGREITEADFEAAAFLLPHAQPEVLERVESPSISGDTLDTIARAIRNYRREDSIVVSGVGEVANRDAIAQAADQLLVVDDVTVTVVFGLMDGVAYLSGRTRGSEVDIGETMRHAFDQIGSAGGHSDMAGAQLPLGIIGEVDDEDSVEDVVQQVIVDRLFEVFGGERPVSPVDWNVED